MDVCRNIRMSSGACLCTQQHIIKYQMPKFQWLSEILLLARPLRAGTVLAMLVVATILTVGLASSQPTVSYRSTIPVNGRIFDDSTRMNGFGASSQSLMATVAGGAGPGGVAVNSITGRIYLALQLSNMISVVDSFSNTVIASIPLGASPSAISLNPNTNMVYVANVYGNTLIVINGSSNAIVASVPVGFHPVAVAANPNTDKIYTTNLYGNSVSVVDGSSNTVVATVNMADPSAVDLNPSANTVYVTNYSSDLLSIMDSSSNSVIA